MSKIKYVLLGALCFVFALCIPLVSVKTQVTAEGEPLGVWDTKTEEQIAQEIKAELEEFIEYGKAQNKEREFRVPGSEAEFKSAVYIHGELLGLNTFAPVNDGSTTNGYQNFNFKSEVDGLNYTSQNIVFKKESALDTDKKVILSAHYDSTYVYRNIRNNKTGENTLEPVVSDGVNDNAGGVALLLTLAKNLDLVTADIGYDIEIVFFGASTNNYDGATFYNRGKSDKDCDNTLLMINFDKLTLGKYTYAYVNEFESSQEKYMRDILGSEANFKKLKSQNVMDVNQESPNGLSYTHVGLNSDHAKFMARGINVLNFFSGSYEQPLTLGFNEYDTGDNVTYTENDSYTYILEKRPTFAKNLVNVYMGVNQILWDDEFVTEMERDNNLASLYGFWTNERQAVFITAILLIVFIGIYYAIYHILLKKSKKTINDNEIDKIVIKITSNLGDGDEEINSIIDDKINDDVDRE